MAKVIKTITSVEFNIQIKYSIEKDIITQTFVFLSKKYFRYIYDTRYVLNSKIEDIIKKNLLSEKLDNVKFVDRTDDEKFIEMKYKFKGDVDYKEVRGFFATILFYLPPFTGCKYCVKAEQRGEFIYCPEKNKTYLQSIKRCDVFKQKSILTT